MSDSESRGNGAKELIARAQQLADTPRPISEFPLEWLIEASHVGDLTAVAIAALRASKD